MIMHEIAKVTLDTEMDLILAHKHTMKLAELTGMSLASQTTFATAVSEVSRTAIDRGLGASLILGLDNPKAQEWNLVALLNDRPEQGLNEHQFGLHYAQKLVDSFQVNTTSENTQISLYFRIFPSNRITEVKINQWKSLFQNELALSPYEEIKRKNRQLHALADRLKESENRYRSLTDSLPLIICTVNPQGKLLYANEWLVTYTGMTIQTINDRHWEGLFHAEDPAAQSAFWMDVLKKLQPFQFEVRIPKAQTQQYRWHMASFAPMFDEKKTLTHWSGFFVDIHAQKTIEKTLQANEALKHTQQKLEEYQQELESKVIELNRSNEELAQFAYVASHDLQEPLRKIQSFSTMLRVHYASDLKPEVTSLLDRMHSSAERMHGLIKDLLTYSRLNTQPQPFQMVSLTEVFTDVLEDLDSVIQSSNAQIDLGSLPAVAGNSQQLYQLFQNLISNALKFVPEDRTPQIRIYAHTPEHLPSKVLYDNRCVCITVEDNGIGFDEQYKDRIFQLFQRLHTRSEYVGTGIGLTICKKVAELHGGTIEVKSVPGKGSTFSVYLCKGQ